VSAHVDAEVFVGHVDHVPVLAMTLVIALALLALTGHEVHSAPRATGRTEEGLPPMARDMLAPRMKDHAVDMDSLVNAVIRLDRRTTASVAEKLANDDRLARPVGKDDATLNSIVPPKFFELQDQLRVSARELAEVARGHDDRKLAKSFSDVTTTCIACHSLYLGEK
jgi:hypothetical protein